MKQYAQEDYLLLSGIQHYAFCPRQWALIHIETLWRENAFTSAGRVLHNKAHDGDLIEKRGDVILFRSVKVSSSRLGISGECDVLEFHALEEGIPLRQYDGLWTPFPVEYKRGKTKLDDCDRLQLCAQAVCLEEMLCCRIQQGALFYGQPRRREVVDFSEELREKLDATVDMMHRLFSQRHTPKAKPGTFCSSCSLKDLCLPNVCEGDEDAVGQYLEKHIE